MNDRFETVHIWSEELALKNKGRWTPIAISKETYLKEMQHSWNNGITKLIKIKIMIELSENFRIISDTHSWVLEQDIEKTRKTKEDIEEQYIHTEKWYYPKLSQCMERYIEESLKPMGSVVSLSGQMENIQTEIIKLNNTPTKDIFKPNK